MGFVLEDVFGKNVVFIAYRLCGMKKEARKRDDFWERMGNYFTLGPKLAWDVNKSWIEESIDFTYIELLSTTNEVYYIYDNVDKYNEYLQALVWDGIEFFKRAKEYEYNLSNKTKYMKVYSVEKALKVLEKKIYRLKDGFCSYKWDLVWEYHDVTNDTQSYALQKGYDFVSQVLEVSNKMTYDSAKECKTYWQKIVNFMGKNTKLVNALGGDFYELKEIYKASIKIMDSVIAKIENEQQENVLNADREKHDVLNFGKQGEKNVDYAIKWLPKEYSVIVKEAVNNGNECIWIRNEMISEEKQEYDHIVVGPQGVFLIETKYYSGKIIIDKYGNWIQEKDGESIGIQNPIQQMDRHAMLMKDILNDIVDGKHIYSILCLAHPMLIVEGLENSPLIIVKSDVLARYITDLDNGEIRYNEDARKGIIEKINQYKVKE